MTIVGDFNFHWGETDNIDFKQFKALLDAHNLFQHVHQPTHNSCNILDLVTTRQDELHSEVLHSVDVGSLLTDNPAVKAVIDFSRPHTCKKELFSRKLKVIDSAALNHDLILLIVQLKNYLDELLRHHAKKQYWQTRPSPKKSVTVKDPVPWYNDAIREKKRKGRQCERRWRRTGLTYTSWYVCLPAKPG